MSARWLWIFVIVSCLAWAPSPAAQEAEPDSAEVEEEEEEKERDPRFDVRFDVGVEVLFSMIRLRGGDTASTVFEAEVDSTFGALREHPAIEAVGSLLDRGARLEVLLGTLLCHSPPPDFVQEFPYWWPDSSATGATAPDRERLLSAVRGFYQDSEFQRFWDIRWEGLEEPEGPGEAVELEEDAEPGGSVETEEPKSAEGEEATEATEETEPARGLEALEDSLYERLHFEMAHEPHRMYYGSRGNAVYRTIVSWQSPTDTVLSVRSPGRELLAWIAPLAQDSSGVLDRNRWERSMAAELGSAVVEPLADWLWAYLAEYEYLFEYVMRGRSRLGLWDSWGECFTEHLRRAVKARVTLATEGGEAAQAYLDEHVEKGFGLLPVLFQGLAEYEANRKHYPSLADFCPRLISTLGNVKLEVSSREAVFGAWVEPAGSAVVVTRIFPGLTADRAGLAVGDTLVRVDGESIDPALDLEALARERGIGGRLEVEVWRGRTAARRVLLFGADVVNYRFMLVDE